MAEELAKKVCGEVLAGLDPDVLEYISGCVLDNDNLLPKEVYLDVLGVRGKSRTAYRITHCVAITLLSCQIIEC